MGFFCLRLTLVLISFVNVFLINSNELNRPETEKNLRILAGELICPSGSFGISWFSTFLTGKKLSKATNTNNICLISSNGIARYKDDYNIFTCWMYRSACGGDKTSEIKERICEAFSRYEKNTIGPDRIIYSQYKTPNENRIAEFGSTIHIVIADFGNSGKLKSFYDSLPAECKKPLNLIFDI